MPVNKYIPASDDLKLKARIHERNRKIAQIRWHMTDEDRETEMEMIEEQVDAFIAANGLTPIEKMKENPL